MRTLWKLKKVEKVKRVGKMEKQRKKGWTKMLIENGMVKTTFNFENEYIEERDKKWFNLVIKEKMTDKEKRIILDKLVEKVPIKKEVNNDN